MSADEMGELGRREWRVVTLPEVVDIAGLMGAYKSKEDAEATARIMREQGARATVETRLVTDWKPA